MIITPAILVSSYEEVIEKLFTFEGLSERVQIDLCDGIFGLEKTWLPYEEKELPEGFSYEFDLMVTDWRKYLPRVLALSGKRIVVHMDQMSDEDIEELITIITPYQVSLGLAVSSQFDNEVFLRRITYVTQRYTKVFVQVMGIKHIGTQGQPFDDTVLLRIQEIKTACHGIEIQVDGAMNPETITRVKNAGATCVVVGSYLSRSGDVKKTFETLQRNFA